MTPQEQPIQWQGYEHQHIERGADWFWALGIITISTASIAFVFGNVLFGILLLVAGGTIGLLATKPPHIATFTLTDRGLRVDDHLYTYDMIEAFWITDDGEAGPTLLVDTRRVFTPHLVIPIQEDAVDPEQIREYFRDHEVAEVELREPLSHRILELLGF